MRDPSPPLARRHFLAGAAAWPAACGLTVPAAGVFVAGHDRIRVGLVGCGGRGTGAALHAMAAAPGVTVTSMADAFADQLESSAALLAARAGAAFDCPRERRFAGLDAWRRVVEADVDLVILATPPAFRPLHAAAAVQARRHVWCEKPGAVDAAGVRVLAAAAAAAADRGLSFAAGLGPRHDPATTALVARIRAGAAGRPSSVTVRADVGPPWLRPSRPSWSPEDERLRNWIVHPRLSGGHFVERHVVAIDTALWVLGDVDPVAATPDPTRPGVRYVFADGRHVDASLLRRRGASGGVEEVVRCERGTVDLRRTAPLRDPLAMAMAALVAAVRSARRVDESAPLCRATLAAIAGRRALESGSAVTWDSLQRVVSPTA